MPNKCIFTITTGRSGTTFLEKLLATNLKDAEAHHEILRYDAWGMDTPDLSDLVQFNAFGNTEKVKGFWKRKFSRIAAKQVAVYVETSHMLAKAGLLENLASLKDQSEVYIVLLRRDIAKIVRSIQARNDLRNKGSMWLWYLDPDYPNKIVDAGFFRRHGWTGICVWYVCEMLTRAEYYRLLLSDTSGIHFLDVDVDSLNDPDRVAALLAELGQPCLASEVSILPPQNTGTGAALAQSAMDSIEKIMGKMVFDPRSVAEQFIRSGHRLAKPVHPRGLDRATVPRT